MLFWLASEVRMLVLVVQCFVFVPLAWYLKQARHWRNQHIRWQSLFVPCSSMHVSTLFVLGSQGNPRVTRRAAVEHAYQTQGSLSLRPFNIPLHHLLRDAGVCQRHRHPAAPAVLPARGAAPAEGRGGGSGCSSSRCAGTPAVPAALSWSWRNNGNVRAQRPCALRSVLWQALAVY